MILVADGGCLECVNMAMGFGSWVAGKKLEGPGARSALPVGKDVDSFLGSDFSSVGQRLKQTLTTLVGES